MLQRVARDEKVPLVQVNLIGANDELIFDGHSVALDRNGEVLAMGQGFVEEIFVAEVDGSQPTQKPQWPVPEELLFRALSLGVRDYVTKCGFKSVVLGLSGGIDSAITAVIAVDALGADKVMGVSMPARYSSSGSLTDAEALAKNLGIRYEVLPIETAFKAMEGQLAKVFAGTKPNEAEENIQSRLRGVTLMALSNKFGALVLTTGNKSEMAVGYCTLYGDMCGALAVIADVFKTDVYKVSRWINREKVVIPTDSITKPPSAELRPDQKDQDSLPEYDVLDAILRAYIEKDLSVDEIVASGAERSTVVRVTRMVDAAEYKRRQGPLGIRVTQKAFGKDRRMPVTNRYRG